MATKSKMAPASTEEQFKFLISCIRHSSNGKVDFNEVANECNIVSKGAAAKRYERLMKQHGLYQGANARDNATTSAASAKDTKASTGPKSPTAAAAAAAAAKTPKTGKVATKKPAGNKKRKIGSLDSADNNNHDIQDDNEGFGDPVVKSEHATPTIKADPGAAVSANRAMGIPPPGYQVWHDEYATDKYPTNNMSTRHRDTDEGAMFQDFLHPAAFNRHGSEAHGGEYAGFGHGPYASAYHGAGMASADADVDADAVAEQESILID